MILILYFENYFIFLTVSNIFLLIAIIYLFNVDLFETSFSDKVQIKLNKTINYRENNFLVFTFTPKI